MNILGSVALATGYVAGSASLDSYAQDSPTDDTKQAAGVLESRLVDVPDDKRFDVFNRVYDNGVIAKYDDVSDEALDGEYGAEFIESVGKSKKMRGFFIGFSEAIEDAYDNPELVIRAMDESDIELYEKFDATEFLKEQDNDPIFREMIGVTSDYKFSPDNESDRLAAFVSKYIFDDMDTIANVSVNFATSLGNLVGETEDELIPYKIDVNSPRFKRAADFMTSIGRMSRK